MPVAFFNSPCGSYSQEKWNLESNIRISQLLKSPFAGNIYFEENVIICTLEKINSFHLEIIVNSQT